MVFTKVPDADLLREGLRSLSFYLNKDSIMVYSWTIKPPVRILPPNEKANFSEAKLDIPRRATQLTVSWALPKS